MLRLMLDGYTVSVSTVMPLREKKVYISLLHTTQIFSFLVPLHLSRMPFFILLLLQEPVHISVMSSSMLLAQFVFISVREFITYKLYCDVYLPY